jgi:hypothetical protein
MKGAPVKPKKSPRIAAAAAMVVCMLVAVAALGGVGYAQTSSAEKAYGKKVTICHKGKKTISIAKAAWPAHQRHGDTLGTCASAAAKAAKAKKAKAAKAKAAKAEAAKAKAEAAKAKGAEKKAENKPEQAGNPGKGKGGKG